MPSRGKSPARVALIAVLLIAIVGLGVGTYLATRTDTSQAEPRAVTLTPTTEQVATRVAWLGDSYTAGTGDNSSDGGYAKRATQTSCWTGEFFGEGGTGYTTAGKTPGAAVFDARVADVVKADPQIVVVQGSTNDSSTTAVAAAATKVFNDLHAQLPKAEVIAIGPLNPPKVSPASVSASRLGVEQAAAATRTTFVDTTGWLAPDQYGSDRTHPTPEGHALIAVKLKAAIAAMKLPGVTGCAQPLS